MALNEDLPLLVTLARLPASSGKDEEALIKQLSGSDAKRIADAIVHRSKDDDPELAAQVRAIRDLAGVTG